MILKGVEALARWNHPELGFVPPIEFVPMAERFGLISAMTHGLLRKALLQKREWQKKGVSFHLAFNLSPLSLADKGLAEKVADLANEYDVEPSQVVLEITENAVSGEISAAIETMARLRLKGFKIAIDDYGTGYANAQQLSRVPASELKIDRCLVDNVATRPQQQSILKSTVSLAKDLGLNTVAEGIEYIEDLKYVQPLGIDLIQGYLFAKPMPADKLQSWITKDLAELRKLVNQQLTDA